MHGSKRGPTVDRRNRFKLEIEKSVSAGTREEINKAIEEGYATFQSSIGDKDAWFLQYENQPVFESPKYGDDVIEPIYVEFSELVGLKRKLAGLGPMPPNPPAHKKEPTSMGKEPWRFKDTCFCLKCKKVREGDSKAAKAEVKSDSPNPVPERKFKNTAGMPVEGAIHKMGDFMSCKACVQLLTLDSKMDLLEVLETIKICHRRPRLKELEKLTAIRIAGLMRREERVDINFRRKQLLKMGYRPQHMKGDKPIENLDHE